jgi:hypothetical protein
LCFIFWTTKDNVRSEHLVYYVKVSSKKDLLRKKPPDRGLVLFYSHRMAYLLASIGCLSQQPHK